MMYLLLQYLCRLHEVFYYARISFLHHNIYLILQNKLTMKQEAVLKVSYQILQVIIISKL